MTVQWTPHNNGRLRDLWDETKTHAEVAEVLSAEFGLIVTPKAVERQSLKIGLSRRDSRRWPPEHDEYAKQLAADPLGYSNAVMAEMMNVRFGTSYTRNAMIGRLHRLDITRTARPTTTKPRPRRTNTRVINVGPPKPRVDPVKIRCAAIDPLHLALCDLEPHQCRYVYGDGPFTFCGHDKAGGSSYCAAHKELCEHEAGANSMRDRPDFASLNRKIFAPKVSALATLSDEMDAA